VELRTSPAVLSLRSCRCGPACRACEGWGLYFHLEIMQLACGRTNLLVSEPPCQSDACLVDIAESQPESQASGSQAFSRAGLALGHDATLSACNVPAESKTLEQRYQSHRQPAPGLSTVAWREFLQSEHSFKTAKRREISHYNSADRKPLFVPEVLPCGF
jgi:hypothetical protein